MNFSIVFLSVVFVCFASIVIYSLLLGISPMPSSKKAKEAILQLLPKSIEGGVIYELGSGWGGLAFLLAKKYPKAKIVAFELSPIPFLVSRLRQLVWRRANLTIYRKSFYERNLSDAGAIVCYLFPGAMPVKNRRYLGIDFLNFHESLRLFICIIWRFLLNINLINDLNRVKAQIMINYTPKLEIKWMSCQFSLILTR